MDRVLQRGCWTAVERFGGDRGWQIGAQFDDGCEVLFDGRLQGRLRWELIGTHNQLNALAAIAAARHAGVAIDTSLAALAGFRNVKRRMEVRGVANGITVYDDFAHHPTAIQTTLDGLRRKVGQARILAVLEPRSNTMKLGTMKQQLPDSLQDADAVFCFAGNLGWDVAAALAPLGDKASVFEGLDDLVAAICRVARPGDHVLVMSNGGFGGVHGQLLSCLASAT